MSNTEKYAEIYLNFQDRQAWFEDLFSKMTIYEYFEFIDYFFHELNFAKEEKNILEFQRTKGLMLALARKELEISYFMDDITQEQRIASMNSAKNFYNMAKDFYPKEDIPILEKAWKYSLDHAAQFGYPSPLFDLLAPHRVFAE